MIDRTARIQLGELMRHWASGRVTNTQFDEEGYAVTRSTQDEAIGQVFVLFAYQNEYNTYRFVGKHRLSKKERRQFSRCILFLQNDAEYYDPFKIGCGGMLFALLTFGLSNNWSGRNQHGERIWPFATAEDLDAARQHPKLLCGGRC